MISWTIVVPVKGTPSAKSRLGGSSELARAIALDTVASAVGLADSRVIVVTSSRASPDFLDLGADVVADPDGGLNVAVAAGIAAAGDGPVAVLLGDVPALDTAELSDALAAAGQHPLAMVADADDTGTVLISALHAADHRPRFGAGSRAAHREAGYVELAVASSSGLRRDVDTAEQLAALGSRVGGRTAAVLAAGDCTVVVGTSALGGTSGVAGPPVVVGQGVVGQGVVGHKKVFHRLASEIRKYVRVCQN